MALGPILPGRLPSSMLARRLYDNLQASNRVITQLNDQLLTGQKFFLPSESPAAAVRTIVMQKSLERQAQLRTNIQTDRAFLNVTETSLSSVSDALNRAKSFVVAGIGQSVSEEERQALATETSAILKSVINVGNTKFRGRYLFAGGKTNAEPFETVGAGAIRYNGNTQDIDTFIDSKLLLANNITGDAAFGALSDPVGGDIDPALTLNTKIADLHGGRGVTLGSISVSLNSGAETHTVDLSGAETIGDLKTRLEDAFGTTSPTLTVSINAAGNGINLASSTGDIVISDLSGSTVATDLGIAGTDASDIDGSDLDPRISLHTLVSSLNSGTGIGATTGTGVQIVNGDKSGVVDLDGATTVEDLLNRFRQANLDLEVGINEDGNGIAISTRVSGVSFSIGENGGSNATNLGIRTLTGSTKLEDLNFGNGVPVDQGKTLKLTLRDGTEVNVDLDGDTTVQDVIDDITAAHANLSASLKSVGNGIAITDSSTLSLNTPLANLNGGDGVNLGSIQVSLNGGAQTETVDLTGATTLNDVKTTLEAAFAGSPPTLTVSINGTGDGITLTSSVGDVTVTDSPGLTTAADLGIAGGPSTPLVGSDLDAALVIDAGELAIALGVNGAQGGGGASVTLSGNDVNAREANGSISLLSRLEVALRNGDDRELERLSGLFDKEIARFNRIRGEVGTRLKTLDDTESRLADEEIQVRDALSKDFDADVTDVVTQIAYKQQALQAGLQVAASSLQLSLFSFL